MKNTTGINYRAFEPFPETQQIELMRRCETQEWVGVCDAEFPTLPKCGRALISLQHIRKYDVIVDFHGIVITDMNLEDYARRDYVASEYCLEVGECTAWKWTRSRRNGGEYCMEVDQKPKRIIDATSEICTVHPGNRCLGRLANHALQSKGSAANMVVADILLTALHNTPRVVVLQAHVDIEPLHQLRFDYNDPVARRLFAESS